MRELWMPRISLWMTKHLMSSSAGSVSSFFLTCHGRFRKLGERCSRVAESEGSSFRRQTRTRFSLFRSQSSAGTRSLVRLSPANQDRSVLAHRVLWLVCSSVRGFLKFRSGRYRRHYAWHRRENVFVSSENLSALCTRCSQR